MTSGLITGVGRSGSMWTARALRCAAELDARHESVMDVGDIGGWVEVNSHLWGQVHETPEGLTVALLVRDGRDVARSGASRKGLFSVDYHAKLWADRNAHVMNHTEPGRWYRFEDLLESPDELNDLAQTFGGSVDAGAVRALAEVKVNASRGFSIPHWSEWCARETGWFWSHAGEIMSRLGYPR